MCVNLLCWWIKTTYNVHHVVTSLMINVRKRGGKTTTKVHQIKIWIAPFLHLIEKYLSKKKYSISYSDNRISCVIKLWCEDEISVLSIWLGTFYQKLKILFFSLFTVKILCRHIFQSKRCSSLKNAYVPKPSTYFWHCTGNPVPLSV